MAEALQVTKHKGTVTVTLNCPFNAQLVADFRRVVEDIEKTDEYIVIDLCGAEYIDSAALGLMIHMKKKFDKTAIKEIRICNCNARIRKVFNTMRFQDMFVIDMIDG